MLIDFKARSEVNKLCLGVSGQNSELSATTITILGADTVDIVSSLQIARFIFVQLYISDEAL